ncbi:helix-turn-helix domain-containing protein [Silvibacterium dinghuense]|uniref:helix-turn-helix domain-containing protein n=1 Tax=Silvibacterium dinghuense TaxID=1560006 RepID=UPI0013E9438E|nr:helix-turn-helix domain-containing protein [Silvibacterium dinghuense]
MNSVSTSAFSNLFHALMISSSSDAEPSEDLEYLLQLVRRPPSISALKRAQCILLWKHCALPPRQIAHLLGWSPGTVHNLLSAYRKAGPAICHAHIRGGRTHAYLTAEREQRLLKSFLDRARSTGFLDVKSLHAAYEHLVGHRCAASTIYRLVHRHGQAGKLPRKPLGR